MKRQKWCNDGRWISLVTKAITTFKLGISLTWSSNSLVLSKLSAICSLIFCKAAGVSPQLSMPPSKSFDEELWKDCGAIVILTPVDEDSDDNFGVAHRWSARRFLIFKVCGSWKCSITIAFTVVFVIIKYCVISLSVA